MFLSEQFQLSADLSTWLPLGSETSLVAILVTGGWMPGCPPLFVIKLVMQFLFGKFMTLGLFKDAV